MDAMGLSNKKPHTVSTSHSGSFTHNPPDIPKTPGIVSIFCILLRENSHEVKVAQKVFKVNFVPARITASLFASCYQFWLTLSSFCQKYILKKTFSMIMHKCYIIKKSKKVVHF